MIIEIQQDSDFSIHNLPFGIFSTEDTLPRAGVAIGDFVIDLPVLAKMGVFNFDVSVLEKPLLNDFIALGKTVTSKVRTDIQAWLSDGQSPLGRSKNVFIPQSEVKMHMPIKVGNYTDFYSSIEHATNVGKMFRDPDNALLPNWRHMPVGYHGRASSIVVSGRPVRRPMGQVLPEGSELPVFQATKRLDFELEMAFIIGKDSELGFPVSTNEAEDYIFGMVLFNDWSARDIQKWEYVPLGPFLGKSFASSISPWIVTLEALAPFSVPGPVQEPAVLPYLTYRGEGHYDIDLEVQIKPQNGAVQSICQSNFKSMYWNIKQQLAHHTVNGCNVQVGDMMASGTISGYAPNSFGSMLELSWGGSKPIALKNGENRTFIEDYDTVIMKGVAEKAGKRVGFGQVETRILPNIEI